MKNDKIENLNDGMRAYHEGHYETAAKLLMPLATEGNDEAQYYMAMLYLSGEGGKYKPNYEEAIKWLQLSSEQSHPQAQTELGYLYYTGEGTDTNQARAVILYEQAVVLDYAPAKANLGMAYVFGNQPVSNLGRMIGSDKSKIILINEQATWQW